ncbi:hypothetical protein L2E82_39483 [Cichorium intybus]|uniref:Uncharacterized protein n=1 Tax=Cichorium intybus TaxID=13427 RepID=A0ACB9AHL9_CICIN|nr:hypothetical protein L2E82_39483 [Cichorium intybus]
MKFAEELVREFLFFRGFTTTLQSFEKELATDIGKGFHNPFFSKRRWLCDKFDTSQDSLPFSGTYMFSFAEFLIKNLRWSYDSQLIYSYPFMVVLCENGSGFRDTVLGFCRTEVCSDMVADLRRISNLDQVLGDDTELTDTICKASDLEKRRVNTAITNILSQTDPCKTDIPIVYASDAFLELTEKMGPLFGTLCTCHLCGMHLARRTQDSRSIPMESSIVVGATSASISDVSERRWEEERREERGDDHV